jgi:hypothetical protein
MIENKSILINLGDARTANMPIASLLKHYFPIDTEIYQYQDAKENFQLQETITCKGTRLS